MSATSDRYSAVAIVLHWAIAILLIYNLYLGLAYAGAHGMARFTVLQLHKSVGFTVLALAVLRLVWRLVRRPPAFHNGMKPWERRAAEIVHGLFYAILFVMPITGWIIVSASPTNIPTLLYKTLPFPFLGFIHSQPMPARRVIENDVGQAHVLLAFFTMALIVLHVAAALKHQFRDKDGVLYRMVPFLRPAPRA
jgi:cytochrome b561